MKGPAGSQVPVHVLSLDPGVLVAGVVRVRGREGVRAVHVTARTVSVRYRLYRVIRDEVLLHAPDPLRVPPHGGRGPGHLVVDVVHLGALEARVDGSVDVGVSVGARRTPVLLAPVLLVAPPVATSRRDVETQHQDEEYSDDNQPDEEDNSVRCTREESSVILAALN